MQTRVHFEPRTLPLRAPATASNTPRASLRLAIAVFAASLFAATRPEAQASSPVWTLESFLTVGDDQMGTSVAVSSGYCAIGAPYGLGGSGGLLVANAGQIYLRDASIAYGFELDLGLSTPTAGDRFGASVALEGTTLLGGAPGNDAAGSDAGAVYVLDTLTGTELFQLTASDAAPFDEFGSSVALSGTLAVVGAPGGGSGSAYVFDVTTGTELFELVPSGITPGDEFGASVAIDGSIAVVGAPGHDVATGQWGAAWVFDATTGAELFKLETSSVGDEAEFGRAVAIQGDRIVVGSPLGDGTASLSGAAWVFDASTGQALFELLNSATIGTGDRFGASVAISGGSILVGAPKDSTSGTDAGAAFRFDLATGALLEEYLPAAGGGGECGTSVALDGVLAMVGAPRSDSGAKADVGKALVFEVPGEASNALSYSEVQRVSANGAENFKGFGAAIDLSGSIALIGTPRANAGGWNDAGAAYLIDVATGTQLLRLKASSPGVYDEFGFSVSLDGSLALVGSPRDDVSGANSAGSAELFDTTTGARLFKFKAAAPASSDLFGTSVALEGSFALAGVPYDKHSGKSSAGSVYVFDTATGAQLYNLKASDAGVGNLFGQAVAISGSRALVGAPRAAQDGLSNAGCVYVFDLSTGAELSKWVASDQAKDGEFGASLDVDAGRAVVGAPGGYALPVPGKAYVFDLATGAELFTLQAADGGIGDGFGSTVRISGDTIVVSAPGHDGARPTAGAVYTFDARTGAQLGKFEASAPVLGGELGTGVAIDGELLLVGHDRVPIDGEVFVMDPRTLVEDAPTLSLAAGGSQAFELRAGPANAGGMFLFLGSATGTSPGFPDAFNGWNIPLNLDAYTMILMNKRGAGLFSPWAGALDADGVGQSAFGFPGGQDPSLVGTVLHHAFLTTHPSESGFTHISNPVALELVP